MSAAFSLLSKERCFLEAPAGYGKTHTIADTVFQQDGVQLVLTHTNAGVDSLKHKLLNFSVPRSKYRVDTIAGWALRLAYNYPVTTNNLQQFSEFDPDYPAIYEGVTKLLQLRFMQKTIALNYDGVIVDEYQDCTKLQHSVILALAAIVPCRILGDPLQGIFDFQGSDPLVDWDEDIVPRFDKVPKLELPYRWVNKNVRLGKWLTAVRARLMRGQDIDLRTGKSACVRWVPLSDDNVRKHCWNKINSAGSVAIIHSSKYPGPCHRLASQLGGHFRSIEDRDGRVLKVWAGKFDGVHGNELVVQALEFAKICRTKINKRLGTIQDKFKNGNEPRLGRMKYKDIGQLLLNAANNNDFAVLASALNRIDSDVMDSNLFRADLWFSMLETLAYFDKAKHTTLMEVAWQLRQIRKHGGQRFDQRIVSRTLLIKGLEFDHSILVKADKFDSKNLYVALTRASTSVTVISPEPILKPRLSDRSNCLATYFRESPHLDAALVIHL